MYNNPFAYTPYMQGATNSITGRGLLSSIKAINWSGILSNTQKTLGIINQTIPIVYQVKPIINNAKTMFKIANTIKNDPPISNNTAPSSPISTKENANYDTPNNRPMFFI